MAVPAFGALVTLVDVEVLSLLVEAYGQQMRVAAVQRGPHRQSLASLHQGVQLRAVQLHRVHVQRDVGARGG